MSPRRAATQTSLNASTLALVLAGGNGTRLDDLTRWECKPALPFAGKFRNIDFSLSNCVHSGIRRMAVLTQYKSQSLIHHLEEAWSFMPRELGEFIDLWPAQQRVTSQWYRGTADAVYQNLDLVQRHSPQLILVLAGDHIYKMDYRQLLLHHLQSGAEATVACVEVPKAQAGGIGVMTLNSRGRVETFVEKPATSHLESVAGNTVLGSMGVYVFNASWLYERLARDAQQGGSAHDFGRDVLPVAVAAGETAAFVFTDVEGNPGYWRDVGTLDSYWRTHMELLDPTAGFSLFDPAWPVFTHARQLPPTQLLSGSQPCVVTDSMMAEGCIIDSATVMRSVLAPGVQIGEESVLEETVVLPDARIGAGCRLRKVIVDRGCAIPDGCVIGEDIAGDKVRFAVSADGVILVTAESLAQNANRRQVA